jgi:RNA polymerase sigma factor (sigma-70 family)
VAEHEAAGRAPAVPGPASVGDLVVAAREGDEEAWRAIVLRYVDLVWAVARGHGLDHCDAADVTQTTWLRLYEHLPRLRDPERVAAWLTTTARRESLRVQSRRRQLQLVACFESEVTPVAAEDAEQAPFPAELLAAVDRDERLWLAFSELPAPCRTLLRALMADPPPSYAELSVALGMPVGGIGPTRARCLDRLRAILLGLGGPS